MTSKTFIKKFEPKLNISFSLTEAEFLDISDMIGPSQYVIYADIFDLHGNLVITGGSCPVLRRAASGHLFQLRNEVIKAVKMTGPIPISADEISHQCQIFSRDPGYLRHMGMIENREHKSLNKRPKKLGFDQAVEDFQTRRAALDEYRILVARPDGEGLARIDNEKIETNVEFEDKEIIIRLYDEMFLPKHPMPVPLSPKHSKAMSKQRAEKKTKEVHDCSGENKHHRCSTKQFVELGRADSPTLGIFVAEAITMVRHEVRNVDIWRWDSNDDVWIQIAREEIVRS